MTSSIKTFNSMGFKLKICGANSKCEKRKHFWNRKSKVEYPSNIF